MAAAKLLVLLCLSGQVGAFEVGSARVLVRPSTLRSTPPLRTSTVFAADIDDEMKDRMKRVGSDENFGQYRRIENTIYLVGGLVTFLTPIILGIWAYNEGYLTPQ